MSEVARALSALLDIGGDWFWAAAMVFFRVGAAMAFLPAFGEQLVSVRIRLALALAFTAIVVPAVVPLLPAPPRTLEALIPYLLTETLCGAVLGLSLRFLVWLLQVAGSIIAQSTSLAQLFGNAGLDPQPAIAQLMVMAGLALAVTVGLHTRIAEALIESYQVLPPGQGILAADLSRWGVARVGSMFGLAFTFAAPFVIAALIYNVALGVINRAMPQLMVAFVGAPAITWGGLALLLLALPLILPLWLEALSRTLADPLGTPP